MNSSDKIVFIVDDDLSIRTGLARLLKSAGYKTKSFTSAQEFLASKYSPTGPCCLILDINMPGLSGLDLQVELKKIEYQLPIIFITGYGDIPSSVKAMKNGAIDFLPKPYDEKEILSAVEEALLKDLENRSHLAEKEQIRQKVKTLTPREQEIMTYVIGGFLNKEIGYILKISEKTVKVHRGRIFAKMGIYSVAELVRFAEKVGIKPVSRDQ